MTMRRPVESIFPDGVEQISMSTVRRRIHRIYREIKTGSDEAAARSIAGAIADAVGCPEIAARYGYKGQKDREESDIDSAGINRKLEALVSDMFKERNVAEETADEFIRKWRATGYKHGFTDDSCHFVYYDDGKVLLNRH